MSPKERESRFEQAQSDLESGRFKVVPALTIVANLVVGISLLFESDGDLQKIGAIALMVIGGAHAAELASGLTVWRRTKIKPRRQIQFTDNDKRLPYRGYRHGYRTKAARKSLRKLLDAERGMLGADAAASQADMSKQAVFFYAGLLFSVLGVFLSAVGLGNNFYPATLAGSAIASIGFVTLACALVSAEDADKAP